MTFELGSTMKVLRPYPNVLAFYDGRIPGVRAHSPEPNWLDDGAFTLGTASYAIVEGEDALVYDTHMSLTHARIVRKTLTDMGVTRMRVVQSHWHTDHVAGNEAFADCEIIGNNLTVAALEANREWLETNDPPIKPIVPPNRIFENQMRLKVGSTLVELRQLDIHSYDETVMLLPAQGLFFAGDTLEDTCTYVTEPERLAYHLSDLERLSTWKFEKILPNHGSPERIAAGGYPRGFIEATRLYVEKLQRLPDEPGLGQQDLQMFAREALATGAIDYYPAYEPVHRHNVAQMLELEG